MALLDWIFVVFGATIALAGGWIQLYPERVIPGQSEPGQSGSVHLPTRTPDWQLDPGPRAQIRLLGACFLFMGTFFALQMTIDLTHCSWWIGTISGLAAAIAAVTLVCKHANRQQRRGCLAIHQSRLAEKVLELR